jgi:hypothetical protein
VREELGRVTAAAEAAKKEKEAAEKKFLASERDKVAVLRLRRTEIDSLKAQLRVAVPALPEAPEVEALPEAAPALPEVSPEERMERLCETMRRTDAHSIADFRKRLVTMSEHPLLPEVLARIAHVLKS